MAPHKFVIKCGNFAVLVDLHVLPLGAQVDTSWFTTSHIEEVTSLVRDAVDQRVKQYAEFLHNRRQHKQKKELPMASAVVVEGKDFSLAANFLKRHISLRCIVKQVYGDLRVFPERYVVCVSCPEHSAARLGNLSPAASLCTEHPNPTSPLTDPCEKSRSEYFSEVGENQEPSTVLTQTKKTVLQKLAKQARVQREPPGSSLQEQNIDPRVCLIKGEHTSQSEGSFPETEVQDQDPGPRHPTPTEPSSSPDGAPAEPLASRKSRNSKSSSSSEDPHRQRAKKKCLGMTNLTLPPHASGRDPPSPTPRPPDRAESKAFPVSQCKETTLEVELLTSGKRAQRLLPLTSNNTAQTNQNRPAASLRGLSVKLASSAASIASRPAVAAEASESAPRTSRLRRQKRS